jgi:ABC-2 type transport system ATP-binding protein
MLALTQKVVHPVNEGIEKVAIEVRDLHKTYSGKKAVDGISFAVRHNEIFGILGPNGAGKSTALEIIEGLRQPDKNPTTAVRVDGLNVLNPKECRELKQRMGLQLQSSSLFPELSVRENLQMLAMLYRRARPVDGLLQEFDLTEKANALIGTLSGGQQQRVSLAAALVNDPSIVFLDEPTTALDPQARRNVWESVRRLQSAGKTVVLTTHYMEEAQMLCERVAIMDNGRIAALGTPEQLIRQYAPGQAIDCRYAEGSPQLDETVLRALPGTTEVSCHAHNAVIQTRDLSATLLALLSAGENHNARFSEVITRSPSLEDVFLNVTGKKLGNE